MNLRLKQKFSLLAALSGALIVIVSAIAYYISSGSLSESIDNEMIAVVDSKGEELDNWLTSKTISAQYAADLLGNLGDMGRIKNPELLSLTTSDDDILEVTIGLEDKYFYGYHAGDFTGKIDPTVRDWYNDAKSANKLTYTLAYVDSFTNKLVVSAVAPIKINGQFVGATCVDVALSTLDEQVKKMNYRGNGNGVIIGRSGKILAIGRQVSAENIREIPGFESQFDTMLQKGSGYFHLPRSKDTADRVFVYTTMKSAGWIVGIAVDEDVVFAASHSLRNTYLILVVIGALVMLFVSLNMSSSITDSISKLHQHAVELAKGNLKMDDVRVTSQDEVGELAQAFNDMSSSLKNLIGKMSNMSHQVAASSEELTASANQSANTAVHIAERVNEVNSNVTIQLDDINAAKENVDVVFGDIEKMSDKTKLVTQSSNDTAEAAQHGSELMTVAIQKMANIEKSVATSAEVVKKLGENSKQIGQIVDAISAIADQTNLLALNAAIEAARAGEHGRGFAVVSEEVRKLASESQTSAEQIRDRISSIQNDTENAVQAMQAGTNDVKEGTDAIREVGEQFQRIMQRVDGIKEQMDGIGVSMRTVSTGAEKIVAAVESINEVSQKTSEHTNSISNDTETQSASNEEIAAASQALAQLAVEMQDAIGKFKI